MFSYLRNIEFGELPLHPFLFTLYPVFFLYSKNLYELQTPSVMVRPLVVSLCVAAILLGLSYLYFRKLGVAAVMASLFSLSSLTLMGGIVKLLMDWLHLGLGMNGPLVYFSAYAVLVVGPIWILLRVKNLPAWVGMYMNLAACGVLILPLSLTLIGEERDPFVSLVDRVPFPASDIETSPRPDVYFILLDGYARADVLSESFQFDNGPFLEGMKSRGFFVADASVTSYANTIQSTAAMFNLDYLENLIGEGIEPEKSVHLRLIRHHTVSAVFSRLGYTTMALDSGFLATATDSRFDVVIPSTRPWFVLSQFEQSVAKFTRLTRLNEFLGVSFEEIYWRQHIGFVLENLDAPIEEDGDTPVFFQAHVMSPHTPHVLLADGTFTTTRFGAMNPRALARQPEPFDEVGRRYVEQVQGLNRHIEEAVDRILEGSREPPIIAIVSDHGPRVIEDPEWPHRDFGTLFMLFIPGVDPDSFEHDVNDVELFPLILNEAFGFEMPMPIAP